MKESSKNAAPRPEISGSDFESEAEYYAPDNIDRALEIKSEYGKEAVVIAGGTDILVEHFERLHRVDCWLDLNQISYLNRIACDDDLIKAGSMVTHQELLESPIIADQAPLLSQSAREVGSRQIRSRGTLGGNIATASPAGDTLAPLLAHKASFVVMSAEGRREIPADEFFLGPKESALEEDELLVDILIPRAAEGERFYWEKVGKRQAMIISSVTIALAINVEEDGTVTDARPCYGAVAPRPMMLKKLAQYLQDKRLPEIDGEKAGEIAAEAVDPIDDIRGTEEFRRKVSGDLTIRALKTLSSGKGDDR
ncbi:FAD binding domain-containing protein [Halarsenatibacter silvermanii]|uniref:CO dehydrogenase flavoprotein C-terminal domain-containing protein n=1 Tax=Halarsenatibacter silvermanii TaxID=321763 RepID=A0A1G9I9R4_9FIRM|nr:xanthine dehydrogenase family protein subunit M [Halarsenatibacter silvermanii]SDL21988.1 CO dehydrogenase flavoprotein C-terminal domain-containing protein [Halarsenatibacter silvermanii]